MKKLMPIAVMMGWAMLAAAPAARAQAAQPPKGDAAKGKARYAAVGCYQCHGYVGQGGVGPKLAPNSIPYTEFLKYTREPKGQMPPYTNKNLTDQDMADIYAYMLSIPKAPDWKTIPELKD